MDSDSVGTTGKTIWNVQMFGRLRLSCLLPHAPAVIERLQTQKTALLLAIMVFHNMARMSAPLYRADVAARLWPDAEPEVSRDRLSQALSWLRRNLESSVGVPGEAVIRADRYSIALAPGVVTCDAALMDTLLKEERALNKGDAPRSLVLLRQAIELYKGVLLPGVADDDDLLRLERQRLEAAFETALRRAAIAAAEIGETALSAEYARRLLQTDAANENHCALLMRLLFRAGDSMGALKTYTDFAARLTAGGVPPSPALGHLAAEIKERAVSVVSAAAAPAPPLSAAVAPGHVYPPSALPVSASPLATILPVPLTRYFGREQELRVLNAKLQTSDTRLITLLGPGGSGKTRLAVEAAHRFVVENGSAAAAQDTGRAAFFVSLEHVNSAAQILPAVLRVLQQADDEAAPEGGAQMDGPPLRSVVARLLGAFRHPVLALDNAETIAGEAEAAGVIAELLSRVPALCILATSRVRLGIDGEQQMLVPPLPSPHEAVSEADAAGPGGEEDALLMYPSVRLFLDRARHARMDFTLCGENREAVAALCGRLEGIPLAIELCAAWAATLSAAEMLAALDSRFDLLVSRRPDVPPRHRSLYAAIESSYLLLPPGLKTVFCRLSVFRGGWTGQAARAVTGKEGEGGDTEVEVRGWLAELQERSLLFAEQLPGGAMRWRMLDTLREFAWAQLCGEERAEAAARHAQWYLDFAEASLRDQGRMQPRLWLDTLEIEQDNFLAALDTWRGQSDALASGSSRQAGGSMWGGGALTRGLRLCVALDRFWQTRGYSHVASEHLQWLLTRLDGEHEHANTDNIEAIFLARGYTALGRAWAAQGHLPTALAPLVTALQTWRGVGDATGIAGAQMDLGEVCYWMGRKEEALRLLRESEASARHLDDARLCGAALLTLGSIALDEQDIPRAERLHLEALEFARREDNSRLMARVLCNLGEIAREKGRLDTARERCQAALKAAEIGDRAAACYIRLSLGRTACASGDAQQATLYLKECLRYAARSGTRRLLMLCLLLAAQIAGLEGKAERCAVLLGAGDALRDEASLRLIQGEVEQENALIAQARQLLGEAGYAAAYARGVLLPPDAAAAYADDALHS